MNNQTLPTAKQFKQREPLANRQAQGRYADAPELDAAATLVMPQSLVKFRLADLKRAKTTVKQSSFILL